MKEWVVIQDARDEGYEDGLETGRKEGEAERNYAVVENMLKDNMSIEQIMKYTGLNEASIDEIRKSIFADA